MFFKLLNNASKITRLLTLAFLVLLLYYILAKKLNFFFFWESITFAILSLLLALSFFINDIKRNFSNKRLKIILNILIGIVFFIFIVQASFLIIIPNSNAFKETKKQISENKNIVNAIGDVKGYGVLLGGAIQVNQTAEGKSGSAVFKLIIKGDRVYKTAKVSVSKEKDRNWEIQELDISK